MLGRRLTIKCHFVRLTPNAEVCDTQLPNGDAWAALYGCLAGPGGWRQPCLVGRAWPAQSLCGSVDVDFDAISITTGKTAAHIVNAHAPRLLKLRVLKEAQEWNGAL